MVSTLVSYILPQHHGVCSRWTLMVHLFRCQSKRIIASHYYRYISSICGGLLPEKHDEVYSALSDLCKSEIV